MLPNDSYECAEGCEIGNDAVDEHMGRCSESSQGECIPVKGVKGCLREHVNYWIEVRLRLPSGSLMLLRKVMFSLNPLYIGRLTKNQH